MDRWWANCIRNEEERQWIGTLIRRVRQSSSKSEERGYVFTREEYEKTIQNRAETGKLGILEE